MLIAQACSNSFKLLQDVCMYIPEGGTLLRLEVGVLGPEGGFPALAVVEVTFSSTEAAPSGWPRFSVFVLLLLGDSRVFGGTLAVGLLAGCSGVLKRISRRTLPSPPITVRVMWIVLPLFVKVVVWLPRSWSVPSTKSSKRLLPHWARAKNGSDLHYIKIILNIN